MCRLFVKERNTRTWAFGIGAMPWGVGGETQGGGWGGGGLFGFSSQVFMVRMTTPFGAEGCETGVVGGGVEMGYVHFRTAAEWPRVGLIVEIETSHV